jgi:competence/damage-inducible protein CinA-like protein
MNVELLIIGSELTSGDKLDTNGQWLCRRLASLGLPVRFSTLLGDQWQDNLLAFAMAAERADLVVTSGGLGPTQDDLTRETLARVAGVELLEDPASLETIRAMFARRNREMPERNRVQALLPAGAEALFNRTGTAPGIWMQAGRARFACLPGVPSELKLMMEEQVEPRLRSLGLVNRVVLHRIINLFGLGEAEVEAKALDLTAREHTPEVGITASDATISFRIRGEGPDEATAFASTEPTAQIIRERFGVLVLGEGDVDVPHATVAALSRAGLTLATAESCTGGLIAERITTVPGASQVYRGGLVTYATDVKSSALGVPVELIARHGVVSAEVAESMAVQVRNKLGASIGLSVTGEAGPNSSSDAIPVGTVYVGLATADSVHSKLLQLGREQPRGIIQSRAAKHAMNWTRLTAILRG